MGIVIRASDKIDRPATKHLNGKAASADGYSAEDAWRGLTGFRVLGLLHHQGELVNPQAANQTEGVTA